MMTAKNIDNSKSLLPSFDTNECKLCNTQAINSVNDLSFGPVDQLENSQQFYLCTVTCCDSANCKQFIAPELVSKTATSCVYNCAECSNSSPTANSNNSRVISVNNGSNCTLCAKARQIKSKLSITSNPLCEPNFSYVNLNKSTNKANSVVSTECVVSSDTSNQTITTANVQSNCNSPSIKADQHGFALNRTTSHKDSIRRSPKLQIYMTSDKARLQSPELSSSPLGANSSYTEYTETYTPICTSANSNPTESNGHFKFNVERKSSPFSSEYQFYLSANVANHGFFRKAVPALPIPVAVLLCVLNLILPGSGTLLAALSIVFGSQTEYGPGYGYQAFFICFLSAILQFTTAIFVFGWVWSIMWGIVFIKNSLRYGEKRDIHTMSLC